MLADLSHGRGVLPGTKVGKGVAVGAGVGVADANGFGVATCACAPAKKATKPTRTHTLRKAIPDFACLPLDVGVEWISFSSPESQPNNSFEASLLALSDVAEFSTNTDHLLNWSTLRNALASRRSFDGDFPI